MVPANHKYFLLSDLASSRDYELCVLAVYDDGITTLTGTKLVGCVSFTTDSEYGRCHSIRDQVCGLKQNSGCSDVTLSCLLLLCPVLSEETNKHLPEICSFRVLFSFR